jgi:hypothetical protein
MGQLLIYSFLPRRLFSKWLSGAPLPGLWIDMFHSLCDEEWKYWSHILAISRNELSHKRIRVHAYQSRVRTILMNGHPICKDYTRLVFRLSYRSKFGDWIFPWIHTDRLNGILQLDMIPRYLSTIEKKKLLNFTIVRCLLLDSQNELPLFYQLLLL